MVTTLVSSRSDAWTASQLSRELRLRAPISPLDRMRGACGVFMLRLGLTRPRPRAVLVAQLSIADTLRPMSAQELLGAGLGLLAVLGCSGNDPSAAPAAPPPPVVTVAAPVEREVT